MSRNFKGTSVTGTTERDIAVLSTKLDILVGNLPTTEHKLEVLKEGLEILANKIDRHIQEEAIALAIKKEQEDRQKTITKWVLAIFGVLGSASIYAVIDDILSPFFLKK